MKKTFCFLVLILLCALNPAFSKNPLDLGFKITKLDGKYDTGDVGTTAILIPGDTVDSGAVIVPTAIVKNYGDSMVSSFYVNFKEINLRYNSSREVIDLQPDESRTVEFNLWPIRLPGGAYTIKCSTMLEGDIRPSNDAIEKQIFCRVKDVAVLGLLSLPDTVDSGTVITPKALIKNFGSTQEPFWAIFKIGNAYTCSLSVTNLAPATETTLTFSPWISNIRGIHTASCTLALDGDANPANNVLYRPLVVRVKDFGISQILEPSTIIPESIPVIPKVLVTNYGNFFASSMVFLIITDSTSQIVYRDSNSISLEPQISDSISFVFWNGGAGLYSATAYTKLEGDVNPNNDTMIRHFFAGTPNRDVGVVNILAPLGTIQRNPVYPKAEIKNFGNLPETFFTFFKISRDGNQVYLDSSLITDLPAGRTIQTTFSIWSPMPGNFRIECYTALDGDMHPENNLGVDSVKVETLNMYWVERKTIPQGTGSKQKPVKAGGALTFVPPSFIFAFKGNGTNEFYCYDITADTWGKKETIPWVGKKKRVKAGGSLCYDGERYIYALKGGNTTEFWRYDTQNDSAWKKMVKDVRFGTNAKPKKVKSGSCIIFVPKSASEHLVYLLKANSTFEFFAYWIEQDSWIIKPNAPEGPKGKKFKAGSCMTYDHNRHYIWVLKGGTSEFYAYDLNDSIWLLDKPNIPLIGTTAKKKKVKDGGSIAYSSATHSVYALKGGNTNEFWHYVPGDSWFPMADFPTGTRRVKSGGALVFVNGNLYALRGNKTFDFYVYNFGSGVGIEEPKVNRPFSIYNGISMKVQPNPFSRSTQIYYSIDGNSSAKIPVTIKLYNIAGRMKKALVDHLVLPGTYKFDLNSAKLPKGIYFIRLTALNRQTSQKLVITGE